LPMNFIGRKKWDVLLKEAGLFVNVFDWNWKQKKGFDPVRHIFLNLYKNN